MTAELMHDVQPVNPELSHEPEVQYAQLTGHYRTNGTFKTTDQLHSEYVGLTDKLVEQMVNGVEVVDHQTGERTTKPVDYVVWLDKSARPVSWLTHDLWDFLAADAEGNVPEEPKTRFVNIDRNQWTATIDPNGVGASNVGKVDPSIIRSLRSIFLENPNDRSEGLTERIDTAPTQFDGKTVLIVDEVLSSGRTLDYATKFFERAFPNANIAGTYWMSGRATKDKGQSTGNNDLPVWYTDKSELGRGIGNRNIDLSLASDGGKEGSISAQRYGAWFLSVALAAPDPKSNQLRAELHQLAEDAREGKVLITPSRRWDDMAERAVRLNDLNSVDEYVARKAELAAQSNR